MINHADDHNFFIANAKKLEILGGGDKFKQYHEFILSALNLLKEEKSFPIEASQWEKAARACLERKISAKEVENIQEKIISLKMELQSSRELSQES